MGDNRTFAYFNTKSKYDQLKDSVPIDNETIVFVGDNGKIYTHGKEFGGSSSEGKTYTGSTYINVDNTSNTISLKTADLENKLSQDGFMKDTTIHLNDLSDVDVSGALNNFVLKYRAGMWRALEDETGNGGGGQDPSVVRTKSYFHNFAIGQSFVQPTVLNFESEGWTEQDINPGENEDTWMILVTFQGTNPTSVSAPINITQGAGSNGVDTEYIEWVYLRSNQEAEYDTLLSWQQLLGNNNPNQNGDVIVGGNTWTNHPQGITPQFPYEYESYRTKENGVWSAWSIPHLRSAWGVAGRDGDGVEYIFLKSESALPPTGNNNPQTWTNHVGFLTREYIYSETQWQDNPVPAEQLSQGDVQWVSQRKYNGETKLWEAYSEPSIWSYYSKDGVVDGYTYRLTNEIMAVGTGGDNNPDDLDYFINSTAAEVFHNGTRISDYTLRIDTTNHPWYRTDGATIPSGAVQFTPINNAKEVQVEIHNLTNFAGASLVCPIFIDVDGRTFKTSLTVVGIRGGVDGKGIDLKVSADAIRVDYHNTVRVPSTINVGLLVGTDYYTPGNLPEGFAISYRLDGDTGTPTALNTETFAIPAGVTSMIEFLLTYNNSIIDRKVIPLVYDGAPAIGPSIYSIDFINGTVITDGDDWTYRLGFKAYKDDVEITPSSNHDEYVKVSIFGYDLTGNELTYTTVNQGGRQWVGQKQNISNPTKRYAIIYIMSITNTVLYSLVIPIVKDGESAEPVQGLQGQVIRFRGQWQSGVTYYNGEDNGIIYLDIVENDGNYFYKVETGSTNTAPTVIITNDVATASSGWVLFNRIDAAAIDTLIARLGYVKNLTAEQIVITRGSGQNTEVVAGMANGTYLSQNNEHNITDNNGVRIWAGPITNGNVASAPFTVDEEGHVKAENVTVRGTIHADNLYRNVCFCTMSDGGDNNVLAQIVYYNENYQYIEPDGDGREYLNDGEIYSFTQIANLRNQHQSNSDDASWWNRYRDECFIPCIGKSDVIELSTFFTTDHDESGNDCVMLPDPTYCQGKLIELYSNNYNSTDKDRNRKFRVAAIGKNGMGNMVSGMFRQLNGGFETSTLSDYVVCETGCQYRFVAATVNNTPAWIKLEAYPKYHEMFMFDYDHYIYIDRNDGNKLMYHRGGGAADVTIAN